MNRTLQFAKRNLIELSRDVLGYIFCIAFPILMLIVMSVVNDSIPKEAGMTTFRIDNLAGGIIVFGQTFVMLFTAILVATDRSKDYTNGYILPMILISIIQAIVIVIASGVTAMISGVEIKLEGLLLVIFLSIPSAIMFLSIGLIFGSLLNEKSAPACAPSLSPPERFWAAYSLTRKVLADRSSRFAIACRSCIAQGLPEVPFTWIFSGRPSESPFSSYRSRQWRWSRLPYGPSVAE